MPTGHTALAEQLGGSIPDGVSKLADDELADLAEAIAAVRARQAAELDAGIEQALKGVPRLLRGTARKVLLG